MFLIMRVAFAVTENIKMPAVGSQLITELRTAKNLIMFLRITKPRLGFCLFVFEGEKRGVYRGKCKTLARFWQSTYICICYLGGDAAAFLNWAVK